MEDQLGNRIFFLFEYIEWSGVFSMYTNNKKKFNTYCHTKLHSIMGCEEWGLATLKITVLKILGYPSRSPIS